MVKGKQILINLQLNVTCRPGNIICMYTDYRVVINSNVQADRMMCSSVNLLSLNVKCQCHALS